MRFLVLNPPYVVRGSAVVWPDAAMLPVGPLAIATALEARGHELTMRDLVFADELPERIDGSPYDAVLVACHTFRNVGPTREVLKRLVGASHVVLGGNLTTDLGIDDFRELSISVDAVVRGYGHGAIDMLESRARGDLRPDLVPDSISTPNLALLEPPTLEMYLRKSSARYPIIGPGGFGCAWSCNYCSAKMDTRRVARRMAEIYDEAQMAKRLGHSEIWCVDNIVLADAALALEFDGMMNDLDLTWLGMTRAETVCTASASLGKFRRLTDIAMGVEGPPRFMSSLNRGVRDDNASSLRRAFGLLRDAGIASTAFVMLDLPGSADDDCWDLVQLLTELQPGNVSWSFYNPPPRQMIRNGIDPDSTGFYRWPLGCGRLPPHRVAQHAMVITGTWWMRWAPAAFVETPLGFGVEFDEGVIEQAWAARSEVGDLWNAWDIQGCVTPPITLETRGIAARTV